MWDFIRVLYRELIYRQLKENPEITDDKFEKEFRKASNIKRDIATGSFFCLVPGLLIFTTIVRSDTFDVSSLLVSVAVLSFVFSLVSTVTQSSFIVLRGIFDPLKVLPIDYGTVYLSGLLSISIIPVVCVALPSLVYVGSAYPVPGILASFWIITGIFGGHTAGLFIASLFGLKIKHKTGKKSVFTMATNVLMVAGYIGSLLVMMRISTSGEFVRIIVEYPYVYPFSLTTVFDPVKSIGLLLGHIIFFGLVYFGLLKTIWSTITEPQYISEPGSLSPFRPSLGNDITALSVKDFKILFKQPSLLVGFLAPITSVLVLFFIIPAEEGLIEPGTIFPLFLIGIISAATSNIPLTIEGTSIDFLRMLPLKKERFAVSKAVTVLVFPLLFSFLYVVFYGYYDKEMFYFLPYAFFIPVISSFLSMNYYFRYKSDQVGVPKISWARTTLLMLSVILLLLLVYIPVVFIAHPFGYVIGYLCSCGVILVLWKFLASSSVSPG